MKKIDPQPKLACVKSGYYLASYMDLSVMLQQRCQGDLDALVLRVLRKSVSFLFQPIFSTTEDRDDIES